jgi:hypothetical protein
MSQYRQTHLYRFGYNINGANDAKKIRHIILFTHNIYNIVKQEINEECSTFQCIENNVRDSDLRQLCQYNKNVINITMNTSKQDYYQLIYYLLTRFEIRNIELNLTYHTVMSKFIKSWKNNISVKMSPNPSKNIRSLTINAGIPCSAWLLDILTLYTNLNKLTFSGDFDVNNLKNFNDQVNIYRSKYRNVPKSIHGNIPLKLQLDIKNLLFKVHTESCCLSPLSDINCSKIRIGNLSPYSAIYLWDDIRPSLIDNICNNPYIKKISLTHVCLKAKFDCKNLLLSYESIVRIIENNKNIEVLEIVTITNYDGIHNNTVFTDTTEATESLITVINTIQYTERCIFPLRSLIVNGKKETLFGL